jgi:hypothetical protein
VNSHELITALVRERAGCGLHYALVDLPSNLWHVASQHLQQMVDRLPRALLTATYAAPPP